MKTTILIGIAVLSTAAVMVSCKSDDKKPVTERNSTTTTTVTETTITDPPAPANGVTTNMESGSNSAAKKDVTANTKSKATVKSGKSKSNEDPDILITRTKDGTDAENHDGNPYTKNNQTPQPTGPPIK
ncbi:hypothetical protein [Flavobacterium sp.]|uniref:hypothetical protein n=1 Tax=Flavobacterium sp. TaxID=239 RepID=UPI002624848E|nr:hypothetical protein [Flavobacterium sp.]